jgi:hypothetical protein
MFRRALVPGRGCIETPRGLPTGNTMSLKAELLELFLQVIECRINGFGFVRGGFDFNEIAAGFEKGIPVIEDVL